MQPATSPMEESLPAVLRPARPVGIVGYGAYVPRYRLPASEVNRVWKERQGRHADQRKSRAGAG